MLFRRGCAVMMLHTFSGYAGLLCFSISAPQQGIKELPLSRETALLFIRACRNLFHKRSREFIITDASDLSCLIGSEESDGSTCRQPEDVACTKRSSIWLVFTIGCCIFFEMVSIWAGVTTFILVVKIIAIRNRITL